MMSRSVDLPQPLGPTRQTNSPSDTVSDTFSKASTVARLDKKRLETPSTTSLERAGMRLDMAQDRSPARASRLHLPENLILLVPGFLVSVVVAVAARFLSDHYGAPAMLMALLLGIAFHFLAEEGRCVPGIAVSAKGVLRFGVALLGIRVSVE